MSDLVEKIHSGKSKSITKGLIKDSFPLYGSTGIIGRTVDIESDGKVILVARVGANAGFSYIVEGKFGVTDNTLVIKPNNQSIVNYLHNYLLSKKINELSFGSGQPLVTGKQLSNIKIWLPEKYEEIYKVSNLLYEINQRIDTQKKIIEDFKLLIKVINDNHFNDIEPYMNFKKLYLKAKEGGTPDTKKKEYYFNGNIPFIKIDDLNEKYITKNDTFINAEGLNNSSAWIIPSNSVIYSNGATIGEVAINIYPISTKQGILGIVPNESIKSEYLYYLLKSKYFRKQITRITTKGTMEAAYLKDIDNIKCPIEAINDQKKYVQIMNYLTECLDNEKKILSLYKKQKQYLLNHMFI